MLPMMTVAAATLAPTVTIAPGVEMLALTANLYDSKANYLAAIKLGLRSFDTARTYGDAAQFAIGQAIRESGIPRSEFFVTSKVPCCPGKAFIGKMTDKCDAYWNVTKAAAHDFQVLDITYVDLMLLHWPCDRFEDSVAAYKEVEALAYSGKARAIGVSNFNASALASLLPHASIPPAIDQCGFSIAGHSENTSVWGRDDGTKLACQKAGVTYSAYSPLGGIALGGTGHVLSNPIVKAIAAAHNASTAQVALKWVIQQGVLPVTGSSKLSHVKDDLGVFGLTLTTDEMAALAAIV